MYADLFLQKLFAVVDERIAELTKSVMQGTEDYAHYRYLCGQVYALKKLSDYAGEVAKEIEGG